MKYKLIASLLLITIISGLAFLADVTGTGKSDQGSAPAQQSKPRPSSINLDSLK